MSTVVMKQCDACGGKALALPFVRDANQEHKTPVPSWSDPHTIIPDELCANCFTHFYPSAVDEDGDINPSKVGWKINRG